MWFIAAGEGTEVPLRRVFKRTQQERRGGILAKMRERMTPLDAERSYVWKEAMGYWNGRRKDIHYSLYEYNTIYLSILLMKIELFLVWKIIPKVAILINLFKQYIDISNCSHITIDWWIYFFYMLYFLIVKLSQVCSVKYP